MRIRTRTTLASVLSAALASLALVCGQPARATAPAPVPVPVPVPAPGPAPTMPPTAGTAGTGAHAPSARAEGPSCQFGSCYDYVYGRQSVTGATGASVHMQIARPEVDPAYSAEHSLQELSLQSADQTSTVEVGWTVDRGLNGDALPHLFVYHWVNGETSCYNGCGWVQVSDTVKAGTALQAGTEADFAMRYVDGDWRIFYDGAEVGYFPGSLWDGTYTSAQLVTAFGEVAQSPVDVPSCTQMGNGRFGSAPGSSLVSGYTLDGATEEAAFDVVATTPASYDYGNATDTSFTLGGPGSGPC